MKLYPSLTQQDFLTVIQLQNDSDGNGDYIKSWNHPEFPRPTEDEIKALIGHSVDIDQHDQLNKKNHVKPSKKP
jgi:hypothetical protein